MTRRNCHVLWRTLGLVTIALSLVVSGDGWFATYARGQDLMASPINEFDWILGGWDVRSERLNAAGEWHAVYETTAGFLPIADGAGIQGVHRDLIGGQARDLVWTLSWDQYREEYRLTVLGSFTGLIDVYEGRFDADGALVMTNLHSETFYAPAGQRALAGRFVFHDIGPGSFTFTWSWSNDKGNTWTPNLRKMFTRQP